jgi:hypothetical protein
MENIDNWNKKLKKKVKTDEYDLFEEFCLDVAITEEITLDDATDAVDGATDAVKKRSARTRNKRFWDFDFSDYDFSGGADIDTDYSTLGIGQLATTFGTYMASFDSTYNSLESNIQTASTESAVIYSTYLYLQPLLLETDGPSLLLETIAEYEQMMFDELDCFVITAAKQIQYEMGQCRTIYDVLDGTMLYFCNFLVGPMTVTWMAFLMTGVALTLYIQAARGVSLFFLKMDKVHPGDVSQEDKINAMVGDD